MALPGVRTTILDRFYNLARTDLPGGPLIALVAKRSTATSSTAPDFHSLLRYLRARCHYSVWRRFTIAPRLL
jgi:hypothetical protein